MLIKHANHLVSCTGSRWIQTGKRPDPEPDLMLPWPPCSSLTLAWSHLTIKIWYCIILIILYYYSRWVQGSRFYFIVTVHLLYIRIKRIYHRQGIEPWPPNLRADTQTTRPLPLILMQHLYKTSSISQDCSHTLQSLSDPSLQQWSVFVPAAISK